MQQSLRDHFICRLRSEAIQKKLPSDTYNFQQSVDIALAEQAAANDVKDISGQSEATIHYTKQRTGKSEISCVSGKSEKWDRKPAKKCKRCGLISHSKDDCWHKDSISQCFNCGKKAHLKSQCRAPPKFSQGQTHKKIHHVGNHYVEDRNNQKDDFERAIFAIDDTPLFTPRAHLQSKHP